MIHIDFQCYPIGCVFCGSKAVTTANDGNRTQLCLEQSLKI